MNHYVADTHAFYWYLTDHPRLGSGARAAFEEAEGGTAIIYVSSIVLAELYYLTAKLHQPSLFTEFYQRANVSSYLRLVSFEAIEVLEFDELSPIPEMHDRVIAGLARRLGIPCLTRDASIIESGLVSVVW